jgi:hypothetical protein
VDGNDLRARIDKLGLTYRAAAPRLGLSLSGLHHQMRGEAKVTRRTEMLLEQLEERRQSAITATNPLGVRHRYAAPAPASPNKTISNVDVVAVRTRAALNELEAFARRHPELRNEFKQLVRPMQLRLQRRLEGSEIRQIDEARHARKPKLAVVADEDRDSNPAGIKIGDYVQWTNGGQDQFQTPLRVVWLSEDGAYARVDGSSTGIPTHQLYRRR